MRLTHIFMAALLLCNLPGRAIAADQTFNAPEPRNVLHALDGKTYWEMFGVCFASAQSVLERAALEQNEAQQREMNELAASVLERAIARLVADRGIVEKDAEEIFYARVAEFSPIAEFSDACRLYVRDHDTRFGAPM
jgi:hypothetical protein